MNVLLKKQMVDGCFQSCIKYQPEYLKRGWIDNCRSRSTKYQKSATRKEINMRTPTFKARMSTKKKGHMILTVDLTQNGKPNGKVPPTCYIVAGTGGFRQLDEIVDDDALDGYSINFVITRKLKTKPLRVTADEEADESE
jgi:hypothetical protein